MSSLTPTSSTHAAQDQPADHSGARQQAEAAPASKDPHLQAWEERRGVVSAVAGRDARARLRRHGGMRAIRDAFAALADPAARAWQPHQDRVLAAARTGSERAVVNASRDGARRAAGDAVRGGRHAADADLALAAATAFTVVQFAPGCATSVHRGQRRRRHRH
jgi:hypothetical protein